jgi:PAS domain S-box-containing protein
MRPFNLSVILFILCLTSPLSGQIADDSIKDVVLINSYDPSFQWTNEITQSVSKTLTEENDFRLSVEYMDSKRFFHAYQEEALFRYLKEKYRNISIDGIICSDDKAFEFVLNHGMEIWGQKPIAFCGVNSLSKYQVDTMRVKGVKENINYGKTIELIQQIQPELENLLVISDSSQMGQLFMNQFIEVAQKQYRNLVFTPIYAKSPHQLQQILEDFEPKNKAIYLLSLYLQHDGIALQMSTESNILSQYLDVPIYSNWDFMLNNIIVGGIIICGSDQGREAALIMKEMLENKSSSRPFLSNGKETTILNYREFVHHQLDINLIPPGTTFIHKPPTFIEKYKNSLLILSGVVSAFLLIIFLLARIIAIRRFAETELKKSERRLEMALDGASIGLWDFNFTTGDIFLTGKVAILLGYESLDEIHIDIDSWPGAIHPEDIDQIKEAYALHQSGFTEIFSGELRLRTANGQYRWFSLHGMITERKNQYAKRVLGVIMDINNQKQFEEELKKAKQRAEESDRLKSAFLANMSHEIRTPMNAILGFSDVLIHQSIPEAETKRYLHLIQSSGESLLALINDIIDISKMESGQTTLSPEVFDLQALLDRITLVARTLIDKNKREHLTFRLIKGSPRATYMIFADPYRLEQILNNLISNAIKYTQEGIIELSYHILDSRNITFIVSDTGRGIAAENHQLIFERFKQVKREAGDVTGGTGLGLSITKNLVNLMKGDIRVVSQLNKGAQFIFTIPCPPSI